MKKLLLASAALVVLAAPALAADMAPRYSKAPAPMMTPMYNWSGWYAGVNVGYGWGDRPVNFAPAADPASVAFFGGAFAVGAVPASLRPEPRGVVGGGQIGYNWQSDRFVFGIETDIQGSDVRRTATTVLTVAPLAPITTSATTRLEYFGTVRGRLGIAANSALFYVTGGFAYGDVNHQAAINSVPLGQFNTVSSTRTETGYTAGGGVEWGFAPSWTVKAEYLYVDLGTRTLFTVPSGTSPAGVAAAVRFNDEFHVARVGLNYKWGGPVVARY